MSQPCDGVPAGPPARTAPGKRRATGSATAPSTKAGASTPATHDLGVPLLDDRDRSTKAGASTPATHGCCRRSHPPESALNEGRSVNPGDTRSRHGDPQRHPTLNEGRSVNPGDTRVIRLSLVDDGAAQRRPERQPRRHATSRSLMVGAQRRPERSTPATSAVSVNAQRRPERQPSATRVHREVASVNRSPPLNEGRSVNPGDTRAP